MKIARRDYPHGKTRSRFSLDHTRPAPSPSLSWEEYLNIWRELKMRFGEVTERHTRLYASIRARHQKRVHVYVTRWLGAYRNTDVNIKRALAFELLRTDSAAAAAQIKLKPVGASRVGIALKPDAIRQVWEGDAYTSHTEHGYLEGFGNFKKGADPRFFVWFAQKRGDCDYAECEVRNLREHAFALIVVSRDKRFIRRMKRLAFRHSLKCVVIRS